MLDELDFTKEANNQEIFRTFLKDSDLESEVTAPKVFPRASNKRVLTMVGVFSIIWYGPRGRHCLFYAPVSCVTFFRS